MRRSAIRSLALVVVLMLAATPVVALAGVTHFSFNGQSAIAAFVHASGCVETRVGVIAVDGSIKVDGQPPVASETSLTIEVTDTCTGDTLVAASGSAVLATGDFAMRRLDSATLNGSIEVSDKTSGTTFSVQLAVTWTGIGAVTRTKDQFQIIEAGFVFNSHSDASSRNATASGTISGGGTNYTPDAAVSASLADVRSGEVTVLHP
jgi:hypothetical protein